MASRAASSRQIQERLSCAASLSHNRSRVFLPARGAFVALTTTPAASEVVYRGGASGAASFAAGAEAQLSAAAAAAASLPFDVGGMLGSVIAGFVADKFCSASRGAAQAFYATTPAAAAANVRKNSPLGARTAKKTAGSSATSTATRSRASRRGFAASGKKRKAVRCLNAKDTANNYPLRRRKTFTHARLHAGTNSVKHTAAAATQ
ncbi:uncharacterized protein LOC113146755 [Cyclospora cayetanensis]|uniref:Uncharacterized protein LOC113146755 n=1 Tax=Cyclospora cayetanensis TaxID=88456 RepID=A0A6P6RTK3_9EIME|nr:uncharacterized protein LOC113146755 [Cyclospora cayetanensis]